MAKFIVSLIVFMSSVSVFADWEDMLSYKGDIRVRGEGIVAEQTKKRWRQRVRARLQLNATINEEIKAVLRMASGASIGTKDGVGSANSTNDSFGDNKPFNLDMAYVSWKPSEILNIEAGKLKNAFYRAGGSDIIWDSDWTPEGTHIKYNQDFGNLSLFSNLGGYFLIEDSKGQEATVLGGQLGVKTSLGEEAQLILGAGYFAMNMEGFSNNAEGFSKTTENGNTLDSNNDYLYNYNLMEVYLVSKFNFNLPLDLFVNYVNNSDPEAEREALYFGASVGSTNQVGDYKLKAAYRRVKKDAVLGILNDSNFNAGNTDGEGYTVQGRYKFMKNSTLVMTYFKSEQGVSESVDSNYERYQVDFAFKF